MTRDEQQILKFRLRHNGESRLVAIASLASAASFAHSLRECLPAGHPERQDAARFAAEADRFDQLFTQELNSYGED